MENQTVPAGGFTTSGFDGNYLIGFFWYSFIQETAASGVLNADDTTGMVTSTLDENTGGVIGVDPPNNFPYVAAPTRRFLHAVNGTDVNAIYIVSPTKAYAINISGAPWPTLIEFDHQ